MRRYQWSVRGAAHSLLDQEQLMSAATTHHEVFHEGELAVQQRAGVVAQGRNSGRMIGDRIIPGAIKFVKRQPFVVTGSVDQQQHLWASIVVGRSGFVVAESRRLDIDLMRTLHIEADPLWKNLNHDPRIGILVIDLRSRARLRVNGRVRFSQQPQVHVDVEQAYPNCPQYIQRRNYRPTSHEQIEPSAETGSDLNDDQQAWITGADTMFVASEHPTGGVDASHRGGHPGFMQVLDSNRLRIPDYAGNGMFNTLGNLAVNPHAGLVIPDFDRGRTLQLTGRAKAHWDVDDPQYETGGTRRYWTFEIDHWLQVERSLPGEFEFLDYSPHNPTL